MRNSMKIAWMAIAGMIGASVDFRSEESVLGSGLTFDTNTPLLVASRQTIDLDDSVTLRDVPSLRTNLFQGATASKDELGIDFVGDWFLGGTRLTIGSVTSVLKTNVVYDHNGRWEISYLGGMAENYHRKTTNGMTEQWWITNVVEIKTLKFNWAGKERTVTEESLILSTTNLQALKSEWVGSSGVPSGPSTFRTGTTIQFIDVPMSK